LLLAPSALPRTGVFLGIGICGFLLRIILSLESFGSNDVATWLYFGEYINRDGLGALYSSGASYNHPPLIGLLVSQLVVIANSIGMPFSFLLRSPGILADLATAVLLWRIVKRKGTSLLAARVFAIHSWSLIAILVSGYHGNTDCLYAFLALLAAYLIVEHKRYLWAGLVLGAAINVKLIPLVLVPAFLVCADSWRTRIEFLGALLVMSIPFLCGYLVIGNAFVSNILLYNSRPEIWGVSAVLQFSMELWPGIEGIFAQSLAVYQNSARYIIFGLIFAICLVAHRWRLSSKGYILYRLSALSAAIFLIFAPGIGVQYFVILPAFVLAYNRQWAMRLAWIFGCVALSAYLHFLVSVTPLGSQHSAQFPVHVAGVAFVAWIYIVIFAIKEVSALKELTILNRCNLKSTPRLDSDP